jgi:hypothetical protein
MRHVGSSKTKINRRIVESCFHLLLEVVNIFEILVHRSMSAESAIEKL